MSKLDFLVATERAIAVSSVSDDTDVLTLASQPYLTEDGPVFVRSTGDLPEPLENGVGYYVIAGEGTDIQLALTAEDADSETAIDLETEGTGDIELFDNLESAEAADVFEQLFNEMTENGMRVYSRENKLAKFMAAFEKVFEADYTEDEAALAIFDFLDTAGNRVMPRAALADRYWDMVIDFYLEEI